MSNKRKFSEIESGSSLSSFLPKSFGKTQSEFNKDEAIQKTKKRKVKPAEVKIFKEKGPDPVYVFGKNDPPVNTEIVEVIPEPEDVEEIDPENPYSLPISNEVQMKGHENIVTALGSDHSGARLLSGGYDACIKMWYFPGMDIRFNHFRSIEPPDDIVHTLQFNTHGDRFLMAGSSPQAKIYDKEGVQQVEFVKGYPYITDMAATKGHVSRITTAFWHPKNKNMVVTGSQDSSIRIWDINDFKKHKQIIKLRNDQGASKSPVMASAMTSDGSLLVAVAQDGSLQTFPGDGPYTRPQLRLVDAHKNGSETSSVTFSPDNVYFLTRGTDDTLKVWDTRKLKTGPVRIFDNLPNKYPETDSAFSPGGKIFATGTSAKQGETTGKLHFFDLATLTQVKEVDVSSGSVVSLLWQKETNQIYCGCSDRLIHILFDPDLSNKGVMYSVTKKPKEKRIEDEIRTQNIMNPHALPAFKQTPSARRQREKARQDPSRAHIPEAPQIGPGSGGRLGSSLTASIMKNLVKKDKIDDDPRAALLKYAEVAEKNPFFFEVYKKTQPQPIWNEAPDPIPYPKVKKDEEEKKEKDS